MRIRIQASHVIEVPDDAEIIQGPGEQLIKVGELYFLPEIEYKTSANFSDSGMTFEELDDETCDFLLGLKEEKIEISKE
jgi:hypothetical protein